jgi:hypothetical protein
LKRKKIYIFAVSAVFIFALQLASAQEMDVFHVLGNVLERKGQNPYSRVRKGTKLTYGVFVKTQGDSEVVFRGEDIYYKLYPWSVLKVQKDPVLI